MRPADSAESAMKFWKFVKVPEPEKKHLIPGQKKTKKTYIQQQKNIRQIRV